MARKQAKRSAAQYDVHPAVAYTQAIIANLPAKTGKSIEQWQELLRKSGAAEHKQRREWLKKEHGLGGTTAWLIADFAEGKGVENTDPELYLKTAAEYVEQMYAGPRSALRPLHDALLELGRGLGPDVKVCPCKTIVPLYRHHVFAQIKPATRTRLDFGLALRHCTRRIPKRLLETDGLAKSDRITHRIPLSSREEIDAEVKDWLKTAYDLDTKE